MGQLKYLHSTHFLFCSPLPLFLVVTWQWRVLYIQFHFLSTGTLRAACIVKRCRYLTSKASSFFNDFHYSLKNKKCYINCIVCFTLEENGWLLKRIISYLYLSTYLYLWLPPSLFCFLHFNILFVKYND